MTFQASPPQPSNGSNSSSVEDAYWMEHAIALARQAAEQNEVPVGAIVVSEKREIIGAAYNQPIRLSDPSAHAEILALRAAALALQNYRLVNCTLYVTLEPCLMCAGALVHSRISRLVFGAFDEKSGAVSSRAAILNSAFLNHSVAYEGGILKETCGHLLSHFFLRRRTSKKCQK